MDGQAGTGCAPTTGRAPKRSALRLCACYCQIGDPRHLLWCVLHLLWCVLQVGGIIETKRPDQKNALYLETIRRGDLLLNRVQKLSRVVDVD